MAKLINGNGNPAVYANEDSDWFAAIMGNQTSITAIGEQFRADQADANTIEVFDGVIITKEGRRIQLDANQVDLFEIPTGTQGQTNYYIIGYHLYTDTDSNQFCEVFVQLMESASDIIPEDTFRGGADDVYISLYRVTQDGLNIDSIDLLLPTISTISEINADLTTLANRFKITNLYTNDSNTNPSTIDLSEAITGFDFLVLTGHASSSVTQRKNQNFYIVSTLTIGASEICVSNDSGYIYYTITNAQLLTRGAGNICIIEGVYGIKIL